MRQPTARWGLDRLGEFCREKMRRMAVDVWDIGHALALVQRKLTAQREFVRWISDELSISKPTAYRYLAVYSALKRSEVAEMTIAEAYLAVDCDPNRCRDGDGCRTAEAWIPAEGCWEFTRRLAAVRNVAETWSGWEDSQAALQEVDQTIEALRRLRGRIIGQPSQAAG